MAAPTATYVDAWLFSLVPVLALQDYFHTASHPREIWPFVFHLGHLVMLLLAVIINYVPSSRCPITALTLVSSVTAVADLVGVFAHVNGLTVHQDFSRNLCSMYAALAGLLFLSALNVAIVARSMEVQLCLKIPVKDAQKEV